MSIGRDSLWLLRAMSLGQILRHKLLRRRVEAKQMLAARSAFYRRVWHEAADVFGADVEIAADGPLTICLDGRTTFVDCNFTSIDDLSTLRLAGDKPRVARRLADEGLPIPAWRQFGLATVGEAFDFMQAGRDYVVKPARNTGAGAGVTTCVRSRRELFRAAARAAVFGDGLSIEEQVAGNNYRLLYLDGVLLDAVLRVPPTVAGDGRSTIRALVERANEVRLRTGEAAAQTLLNCDLEMQQTLARQGLTAWSVPAAGQVVRLKTVINDNAAGENFAATHLICDAVIEAGARAAAAVGARLAGIDVITPDPLRPLEEVGGVVLEVNTTPGLYCHYHRSGEPKRVAVDILAHLLGKTAHVCSV